MRRVILSLILAAFAPLVAAQHDHSSHAAGQPWERILPPVPTQAAGKIEVVELFWYGCPHCYDFEPTLDAWLANKPDDVNFVRLPAVMNASWVPHARAFYTAEKLGVQDKIHRPLFDALHKGRKPIFNEEALRDFFIAQGVKAEDFDRVYGSNEVDVKVKQALQLAKRYKATAVPAVIVNGRYRTMRSMVDSYETLVGVIDRLIETERQAAAQQ
jgi:thiol:disulfide interchange protein DsbA